MLISVVEHAQILQGERGVNSHGDGQGGAVLSEHHFSRLRRLDQRLAQQRDQDTVLEWSAQSARARQWVGVLQTEGLTLEILPKMASLQGGSLEQVRRNLLTMLAEAGDVPLRERDLASLTSSRAPLSETLIALFARRLLHQLLLGRAHNYEPRQENLHALRGRLLLGQHIRRNAAHKERFFVSYDEFTADTALNRALKSACRQLLGVARLTETQEALQRCLLCLEGVSDRPDPPQALDQLTLDRRNQRFAPSLTLARMVLAQLSPGASAGRQRAFTLLFDMNLVFEGFVERLLRRRVLPRLHNVALHKHAQQRWRYLLQSASNRRGVLRLEPDILLTDAQSGQPLVTLDTKWKLLDQSGQRRGASREDLYQLYAYAQRYGCRHNLLLYPWVPRARPDDLIAPSAPGQQESLIGLRFLRLDRDLRTHLRDLEQELLDLLGATLPTRR